MGYGRWLYELIGKGCVLGGSVMVLLYEVYIFMYWQNACVVKLQFLA